MKLQRLAALAAALLLCGQLGLTAAAREEYDPWAEEEAGEAVSLEEGDD